ncbi:porin OmpA [[Haemophilus] felis]|nr:porin OmpA [[Haemophilus] felis]
MKKTAIALTIAALAAATTAQAAPQANTFYAGAKAGWASLHDGVEQFKGTDVKVKRNDATYGVFGGYQITNNFAVELGYDYFGKGKASKADSKQMLNHGVQLTLKASYPVLENLDVYARAGAALVKTKYKYIDVNTPDKSFSKSSTKVSPVFAGGLEYAFTPALAARLEYQWVKGVGNDNKLSSLTQRVDFSPSIGSVTAGISYRFGQTPKAPMVAEEVSKAFTLKSDVLFAFNKADLKPTAQEALDGIYAEVSPLKSLAVAVAGYTDYLGSDAYNLELSQRRADSVATYLANKGVAPEVIKATGYGEANPVKGEQACKAVKGRKALIACLAEDRRVEISVKGTK